MFCRKDEQVRTCHRSQWALPKVRQPSARIPRRGAAALSECRFAGQRRKAERVSVSVSAGGQALQHVVKEHGAVEAD